MAFNLKTSKKTDEILIQMGNSTNIPYEALIKLSLALSLRKGSLRDEDFQTDNSGRELNRQTITGDADPLYKCLSEVCANHHMSDEEYFPGEVKAHLDRGAVLLQNEWRYSGNDFLRYLTELEKSI